MRESSREELEWMLRKGLLLAAGFETGLPRYIPSSRFKDQLDQHLSYLEEFEKYPSEVLNKALLKVLIDASDPKSKEDHDRLFIRLNLLLSILPKKVLLHKVTEDLEEIRKIRAFRSKR